jgi:hypothetical protein
VGSTSPPATGEELPPARAHADRADMTYYDTHCYGCGAELSAEVIALRERAFAGDDDAVDELNEREEHRACFE